jgi:hypothetical protein
MRIFSLAMLLWAITCSNTFGQINEADSSAQCIAYWSKGEKMTYSVSTSKLKIKGTDTTSAEAGSYLVDVTVLDSTAKSYTIAWSYRDYQLGTDNPITKRLADMYRNMTVKVRTDEMGSITEVVNWKELRDETNRYYKTLMKEVKELNELPGFKQMMDQMMKSYSSKEAIEGLAVADIQQFHSFHGAAYTLNEQLSGSIKIPNFLGGEPFDADVTLVMDELNVEDGNYVLRMSEEVNQEQLQQATLAYMKAMAKNMGVEAPGPEAVGSLGRTVELATRMHNTGWPIYSIQTKTVEGEGQVQIEERIIELVNED